VIEELQLGAIADVARNLGMNERHSREFGNEYRREYSGSEDLNLSEPVRLKGLKKKVGELRMEWEFF
jgi:hypothetical protein